MCMAAYVTTLNWTKGLINYKYEGVWSPKGKGAYRLLVCKAMHSMQNTKKDV